MYNNNPKGSMAFNAGDPSQQSQFFSQNAQGQPGAGGPPPMAQNMPQNYMSVGGGREPLKLKLSHQERGFYSNMYSQVNPQGKRELSSQTIVQFLMTSGLEITQLKMVWDIAARTSNDFMEREEFYTALRLVAYLQNGIPASEHSINSNIAAPLPKFDDYQPATPGAGGVYQAKAAQPAAAPGGDLIDPGALPDLDSLDFNQPSEQPQLMADPTGSGGMSMPAQAPSPSNNRMAQGSGALTQEQKNSKFYIKPQNKVKYTEMLNMFDQNKSGSLTDGEMQQVMVQTKLEKQVCAKVWDLSNPRRETNFSKSMFFIAFHLMFLKKQESIMELPDQVPQELRISAYEEETVSANSNIEGAIQVGQLNIPQPVQQNTRLSMGSNSGAPASQQATNFNFSAEEQKLDFPPMKSPQMQQQPPANSGTPNPDFDNVLGDTNLRQPMRGAPTASMAAPAKPAFSPKTSPRAGSMFSQSRHEGNDEALQGRIEQRQHDIQAMQQISTTTTKTLGVVKQQNSALQERIKALDSQYEQLQQQVQQQQALLDAEVKHNEQLWAQYNASQSQTTESQGRLSQLKDDRMRTAGLSSGDQAAGYYGSNGGAQQQYYGGDQQNQNYGAYSLSAQDGAAASTNYASGANQESGVADANAAGQSQPYQY